MSSSASGGNTAAWGAASASSSGMMTTGTQTIGGPKTFKDGTFGPGSVPLGCMIVAMPSIDAVNSWQPPLSGAIKDGFMRADGTVINAGHVSQGCLLAAGTVLPNMIQKYPRGNTTSGATGGSNTFTPAGTNATSNVAASGLAFSGTGINPSTTFAAAGNFTDSVSVPASGLSFSGSSTSYSVSVPAHYHGLGSGADLNITSSGTTTVTGTVGGAGDGLHTHNGTTNTEAMQKHTPANLASSGTPSGPFKTPGGSGGLDLYFDTANHVHSFSTNSTGSDHAHNYSLTAPNHTHATGNFSGSIGLVTGGQNGNAAFSASGSNTPSGTIAGTATGTGTATARSSWFTSTTYTPSGTITGTATAAAQAFTGTPAPSEPAYVEVIWVIRVK